MTNAKTKPPLVNNPEYETKDQWTASVLYATGQEMAGKDWLGNVCYFHFKDKERCEAIVNDFYAGKIILDARVLINALKTVKNIIYSKN
jgi:hypothetical protein